jgi:hypothetical protein
MGVKEKFLSGGQRDPTAGQLVEVWHGYSMAGKIPGFELGDGLIKLVLVPGFQSGAGADALQQS